MKLEINSTEWRIFCEKFTQLNQGSLMSVEMIDPGGRTEDVAQELSFLKMTLDTTDACNDVISISLGQRGHRRVNHLVIEPIHVRLRQNGEGPKILELSAENGITRVTFHSGRFPQEYPGDESQPRFPIPS